jgi:hypothetical protein
LSESLALTAVVLHTLKSKKHDCDNSRKIQL